MTNEPVGYLGEPFKKEKWKRSECVVFRKTTDRWGDLSNFAPNYPILFPDTTTGFFNSEALYQACKFPHRPDIQRRIRSESNPFLAKRFARKHAKDVRKDWLEISISVMLWCIDMKLASNWKSFGKVLEETGNKRIVEDSAFDDFWGAVPEDGDCLVGVNMLGQVIEGVRVGYHSEKDEPLYFVRPPSIENGLLLFGEEVKKHTWQINSFR